MPRGTEKGSELCGGEILNESSSARNLTDKISASKASASEILRGVNLKCKAQNGEQVLILNDKISNFKNSALVSSASNTATHAAPDCGLNHENFERNLDAVHAKETAHAANLNSARKNSADTVASDICATSIEKICTSPADARAANSLKADAAYKAGISANTLASAPELKNIIESAPASDFVASELAHIGKISALPNTPADACAYAVSANSKRVKLKLVYSYDGSKFSGSQSQPHGRGVEDVLRAALGRVGIFAPLISSSRTDKGVHALRQVSCVECTVHWELPRLKELINRHCAPYIFVQHISQVPRDFHPRYDAVARCYRYVLNHGRPSPFLSDFCVFYPRVDLAALNAALANFIGEHDFSEFMKSGSDIKSPVRELYVARAYSFRNLTLINFKANGFLRAQVRLMVANALKSVQSGRKISFSRAFSRIPFPPNGLYLSSVSY
ncbi:tRNA pseudouridine(38-40) synthase TruA [uncultured Campylobacter sp.]|uniref:tRNA pseudouridine(38-40) synthase TruA n=1 Tax=uncultured Campylobacter sp. TaxID=218934 RepID=UPI002602CCB8|nr:tRNA pseudouridine(38-40) synthase TruA [uncultured Campylobacter sp.]